MMEATAQATAAAPAAAAKKEAATVKTVKMDDGRTVDFPGSRRLQKTVEIKDGKVTVRLDFVNGETRLFKLPDSLVLKAAGHGSSQKLGDEISGVKDLEDAIIAIDELMGRMEKGEWNETAGGGGEGLAGASILMKACIEYSGKPKEEVKTWLATLNPKAKLAMRDVDGIKQIVQRLEAEKAAKAKPKEGAAAVDTKAILSGLMNGVKPPNSVFAQGQQAAGQAPTAQGAPSTPKPGTGGAAVVGQAAAKTAPAKK